MDIDFTDPPPRRRRGRTAGVTPLGLWLAELRNYPGKWAKWDQLVWREVGAKIKDGRLYGVKPGEFEVTSRACADNRKVHLYARYIGGDK